MLRHFEPRFGIGSINCAGREKRTAAISGTPMNLSCSIVNDCPLDNGFPALVFVIGSLECDVLLEQAQEEPKLGGIILRLVRHRRSGRRRERSSRPRVRSRCIRSSNDRSRGGRSVGHDRLRGRRIGFDVFYSKVEVLRGRENVLEERQPVWLLRSV